MAIINKLENIASVTYEGSVIKSNSTATLLLLAPTVVKSVDKAIASIGETLTYTVVITNLGLNTITNLPFSDTIAAGSSYVTSSFTLNNSEAAPTLSADILTYTIPSIPALGTATLQFQVKIVGSLT